MSRRADKLGLAALILLGAWVLYYWLRPPVTVRATPALANLESDSTIPVVGEPMGNDALASPAGDPPAIPASTESLVVEPARETVEYVVRKHDTLTGIAQRIYGRAADWVHIFNANRILLDKPEDLRPGMRLIIPGAPAQAKSGRRGSPTSGSGAPR